MYKLSFKVFIISVIINNTKSIVKNRWIFLTGSVNGPRHKADDYGTTVNGAANGILQAKKKEGIEKFRLAWTEALAWEKTCHSHQRMRNSDLLIVFI